MPLCAVQCQLEYCLMLLVSTTESGIFLLQPFGERRMNCESVFFFFLHTTLQVLTVWLLQSYGSSGHVYGVWLCDATVARFIIT